MPTTTQSMSIRDAVPGDARAIVDFNRRLAAETEDLDLPAERIADGVAALLADPSKGRYWVAESDGRLVGQIMVTYEWSDWRNGVLWWIQSVYVHPEYRRQGVFSALYRHVESLAKSTPGVRGLRLYVERSNREAQETYRSLGMVDSGYQVMQALGREPSVH